MKKKFEQERDHLLSRWAHMVSRQAPWIVVVAVLLCGVTLDYTVKHLRINTNTGDLFSSSLPFRRDFDRYQTLFPQFKENLVVVLDGETPEAASLAARSLADRLAGRKGLFKSIYLPREDEFLVKHGLLYRDLDTLQDLSDSLAQVQPYLGKLTNDPSLRGLFAMLKVAAEAQADGREIDLSPVFSRVAKAIGESLAGRRYKLSWQELITRDDPSADKRRQFIVLQPKLDYGRLFPAGKAMSTVRDTAEEAGLMKPDSGVRVRLTGGVALSHEELQEVSHGAGIIFTVAFVMVVVVLLIGLRSLRLVTASVITLVVGLLWTAAFAAISVGHLNLISVAFSVLYVGLGVDYSIHFCLRYEELRIKGVTHEEALRRTAKDVGSSLVACAVSTAVAFFAFVPTSFSGVSELGLISGTGMFISLAATLTLLPALLTLFPLRSVRPISWRSKLRAPWLGRLRDFPLHRPLAVRRGALVAGIVGLALLPWVRFNWNPLDVRNPDSESVSTFRDLLRSSETPPWHLTSLAAGAAAARRREDQLDRLPEVEKVVSGLDFIPKNQEAKLDILDELSIVLGLDLHLAVPKVAPSFKEQVEAVRALHTLLGQQLAASATPELTANAADRTLLHDRLGALLSDIEASDLRDGRKRIEGLQDSLLATLSVNLERLRASLNVSKITEKDLPQALRRRWVADDGSYRVAAFPSGDLNDSDTLAEFVAAGRRVDQHITDQPVVMAESGNAVIKAFQQALGVAVVATAVVLIVVLRSVSGAVLVLIPLLLAGLLTGAATVIFAIPFNFANVIALPLLLGIGVDNGIHMVHRTRLRLEGDDHPLRTSTTRGIVFSALTTICSFGNLSFSPHLGTSSMGKLLLIGTSLALLCSLFVLPALLVRPAKSERGDS